MTAGSNFEKIKLLKERIKKNKVDLQHYRSLGGLYPHLCVIPRQDYEICFFGGFNPTDRIFRSSCRLMRRLQIYIGSGTQTHICL